MTTPLFHLTVPLDDARTGVGDASLVPGQIVLECLARINEWHIRRALRQVERGESERTFPPLYASDVSYAPRPRGSYDWLDAPAVLERGSGDREDLAAYRAAELRVAGVPAEPVLRFQGSGSGLAVRPAVRLPDGTIEDPARALGASDSDGDRGIVTKPLVHLSLPDSDDGAHFVPLQLALEGLSRLDEWHIRRAIRRAISGLPAEEIPPLYQSGVRYREEAPGHEDWLDAPAVVRQGHADCEDLAAYRAAELRVAGYPCEPVIKWQWIPREMMIKQGYPPEKLPDRGVWMVHCCVRFLDGSVEDPSKILGMGGNFTERI